MSSQVLKRVFSRCTVGLALFSVLVALPEYTWAQSISLNFSSTSVKDADDYFTDAFAHPKNFDTACDIGFDGFYYSSKLASNGAVTAVHAAHSSPIIGTLPIPTTGTNIAVSREDCNQLGVDGARRLLASKYTQLAFRIKNSYPSSIAFYWTKDTNYAVNGFGDYDGYFLQGGGVPTPANQWSIRTYNLPANQPTNYPWSDYVTGVSLWPSAFQPAGGSTSYDWVRIIDPTSSPSISFSWSSSGYTPLSNDKVSLYVDTDTSGYDGSMVKRSLSSSGSSTFDTGVLAPGTYYLYVALEREGGTSATLLARSPYSAALVVNAKPTLKFTAPSKQSGAEYFRDEVGNPADMNDSADVINRFDVASFRGYENSNFSNGYFMATSIPDPNQANEFTAVDTQVHFNTPTNRPVDTNFYRYFCYKMQLDSANLPRDGNGPNLSRAGWVSRLRYMRRAAPSATFGTTAAHEVVESSTTYPDYDNGFTTYCFDLWDERGHEEGVRWRSARLVDLVGLDPIEAVPATNFAVDFAGLYADNEDSADQQYVLKWDAFDKEGSALQIALFYDTDQTGFNGTQITTLTGQSSGSGTYTWNTAGLAAGTYYVYAQITDSAGNLGQFYSDVSVKVGAGAEPRQGSMRAPCDFDGDGKSDLAIARGPGPATVFTRKSATNVVTTSAIGDTSMDAYIDQDLDGDFVSDPEFVRVAEPNAPFRWFTTLSGSLGVTLATVHGTVGYYPLSARISGVGGADRVIFLNGVWYYQDTNAVTYSAAWGTTGDIPVPGDYDGDGLDNIAVWRPSNGTWYIITTSGVMTRQFGLSSDVPVTGDYNGDNKTDIAVFRPSEGNWYICSSANDYDCHGASFSSVQHGIPGDLPIEADYNGDGKRDPAVFRPATGDWFFNVNGALQYSQFGLPGDRPLCLNPTVRFQTLPQYTPPPPPPPKPDKKKKKKKKK